MASVIRTVLIRPTIGHVRFGSTCAQFMQRRKQYGGASKFIRICQNAPFSTTSTGLQKSMDILICFSKAEPAPWLQQLRCKLPSANINVWKPGMTPAQYAIVWHPPQDFFDEQPELRAVFAIGAGVDALLSKNLPKDTTVVRLDDAGMAVQMAEYVCYGAIRYFREFQLYEQQARSATWISHDTHKRSDFKVAVLGLGVLGQRVAKSLQAFDFPVRGFSMTPKAIDGIECFSGALHDESFNKCVRGAKVLVCILPLTAATENVINKHTLALLAPNSYVINVARGRHIVDEDLLEALDRGHVAGAMLDVFRTEPLPADHPYWGHPKVVVTPHMAAQTLIDESVAQIAGKMAAMGRGEAVPGTVDHARGY
jgi:glyoxylate/hydroxypyruvate reductase A